MLRFVEPSASRASRSISFASAGRLSSAVGLSSSHLASYAKTWTSTTTTPPLTLAVPRRNLTTINTNIATAQSHSHLTTRHRHTSRQPTHPRPFSTSTSTSNSIADTATMSADLVESAKKTAAARAVDEHLAASARWVGIGSGSTVVHVVDAIAAKGSSFWSDMTFVPTGSQSKGLIRDAGLRLCNLDERPFGPDGKNLVQLDVAFDGADEVDAELNCIKGGGACLLQEKLVAVAAKKFVVVADYRKLSSNLCTKWKTVPIEVLPMAAPDVLVRLRALGSPAPKIRPGSPAKAGEAVTDNGMWIVDAPFDPLLLERDLMDGGSTGGRGADGRWSVPALAEELLRIPGVVDVGLFHGVNGIEAEAQGKVGLAQKPVAAYFGMEDGDVKVMNA